MIISSTDVISQVIVGAKTVVAIEKRVQNNLGRPYNDCFDDLNDVDSFDSDFYRDTINLGQSYRQIYCFRVCLIRTLEKKCDCLLPVQFGQALGNDTCDKACLEREINEFDEKLTCWRPCPKECDSNEYTTVLKDEFVYVENNTMYSKIRAELLKTRRDVSGLSFEEMRKRIFNLRINFASMKYCEVSQIPKSTIADLVASLGGTLGLI